MRTRQLVISLFVLVVCCAPAAFAATAEYDSLRRLNRIEAKHAYRDLAPAARQQVWTDHLIAFIANHPDLADDQRDLIYQALGIVSSGMFTVERTDPRWMTLFERPLARTVARAKEIFPPELVLEAFYSVSEEPAEVSTPRTSRHTGLQMGTNAACECASLDPYCDSPDMTCKGGRPGCTPVPSYDCGPFFTYACDGWCQF
ncbi:MAG TPA: bacteriocin fulvocin C-related protein [Thermoanaerobaculia bacterium]|nr:bacteriocin fulvocin C-related protein [Thermoanaerobaculia bacterium]